MRVPFISIIIPVYNMEDKIGRCLDSITCQSFDDIEIIVVDDGSTDRTGDVVKKYASVEPRIRYYREENAGVSTARNNGLQASTGTYLMFIDSDDEIEGGYLQYLADYAKRYGTDILVWGIKKIHTDGKEEEWIPDIEGVYDRKAFLTAFPEDHYQKHFGLYGFVSNKMVKKDVVDRFDLRFDPSLSLMEDFNFFIDCYAHCDSFLCLPQTGYRYYMQSGVRERGSYPQLIAVQIKLANLLKAEGAMTPKNERVIYYVIERLSLAGFLEIKNMNYAGTKSYLDFLWTNGYSIQALRSRETRWKLLKHMILRKDAFGALLYSKFWRMYLSLRKRGM